MWEIGIGELKEADWRAAGADHRGGGEVKGS